MYICTNNSFMSRKHFPVIGEQYGKFTVVSENIIKVDNKICFEVECTCGRIDYKIAKNLKAGKSRMCKICSSKLTFSKFPIRPKEKTVEEYLHTYINRVEEGAKKRNIEFNINREYLINLLKEQDFKCNLTGIDISVNGRSGTEKFVASVDRINNELGYIEGNIQWLHTDVNKLKWAFEQKYFIELCNQVAKYKGGVCGS